jgi:hypothetical protein
MFRSSLTGVRVTSVRRACPLEEAAIESRSGQYRRGSGTTHVTTTAVLAFFQPVEAGEDGKPDDMQIGPRSLQSPSG